METKSNIAESDNETKKTAVLSASPATSDMVLTILKSNEMEHRILAKDQDGRTILQVSYNKDQEALISEIVKLMDFFDEVVAQFIPLLKTALTTLQDQSEQMLHELSKKHETRKFLNLGALNSQTEKENKHGNL